MRVPTVALILIAAATGLPGDRQNAAAAQSPTPKLDRGHAGAAAPSDAFIDHAGRKTTLAAFRGHPVLVNLWATWCAPCKAEMPALDHFAARAKGRVTVLPISQDLGGWHAVDTFFTPGRFAHLTPYLDKENALALKLDAAGLPVSILYDPRGREVWRVAGPVDWDHPPIGL